MLAKYFFVATCTLYVHYQPLSYTTTTGLFFFSSASAAATTARLCGVIVGLCSRGRGA
jgi:hypothetical protein